jgi:hypothetical protein
MPRTLEQWPWRGAEPTILPARAPLDGVDASSSSSFGYDGGATLDGVDTSSTYGFGEGTAHDVIDALFGNEKDV